jgi:hypothetical protein
VDVHDDPKKEEKETKKNRENGRKKKPRLTLSKKGKGPQEKKAPGKKAPEKRP